MGQRARVFAAMLALGSGGVAATAEASGLDAGVRTRATVLSVDGPRDFTVGRDHRSYRLRIDNIDAPLGASAGRRAECGASLATRRLRQLARPGRQLFVFSYGLRQGGRMLVDAELEIGHDGSDEWFSDTLIQRGVARPGIGQSVFAPVIPNTDLVDMDYTAYPGDFVWSGDPVNLARRHVGVWGACHGRFHLAGGKLPPPVRPATWHLTPEGRTTAVGDLELYPTEQTPGAVTTFGDAARVFPDLEIVRSYTGLCVGTSGRSGLRFQGVDSPQGVGSRHRRPCAVAAIRSITSLDASITTAGLAVGGPVSTLAVSFPKVTADDRYAELDGLNLISESSGVDRSPPTAWRTAATLSQGRLTGFFTRLPSRD